MLNDMTSEQVKEIAKKERYAIVQHRTGPAIVVAGPGTGKTTALAERFISLCQEEGCDQFRIVAVTFTNYAADQMKKKVIQQFEKVEALKLRIGTLHSLAKRLLHQHSNKLNLPSMFRVIGRLQEALLIADVRPELKSRKAVIGRSQNKYLARFKASKAFVPDLDVIAKLPSNRWYATQEQFDECYSSLLRYYRSVDWFDVVALAVKLLQEHEDILSEVSGDIDHLLVDEYQDLNRADHELIRLLATKAKSLMVYCDDDQSIYQTGRFANPGGVKNFKNIYRDSKAYPLLVSWRCGSSILDAAWKLINVDENRMPERMPKKKPIPTPEIECGEFEIRSLKSEKEEIQTILSEVQKELDSRQPPNDILVLFHGREIGRKYVETMLSNDLNVKNLLDRPHTASKSVFSL